MDFGKAIEALKRGETVARRSWNGKGMFIYLTTGTEVPVVNVRPDNAKHLFGNRLIEGEATVKFNSHIDMKTADGSVTIGWLASQTDMLSEDWEEIK